MIERIDAMNNHCLGDLLRSGLDSSIDVKFPFRIIMTKSENRLMVFRDMAWSLRNVENLGLRNRIFGHSIPMSSTLYRIDESAFDRALISRKIELYSNSIVLLIPKF